MKKLICMMLCIVVMLCMLCGCGKKSGDEIYDQFVVISEVWNGDLYKVYDKDTHVMYYLLLTSKFELCPVYNTDGSIMVYEEE